MSRGETMAEAAAVEIGDWCEMLVNNGSSSVQTGGRRSSRMATADESQMAAKV